MNVIPKIPPPSNEPVLSYAPSTLERVELKQALKDLSTRQADIPLVIGGKDVRTGTTVDVVMPHCHRHVLAKVQQAGPGEVEAAIAAARDAWRDWSAWRFEQRAAVFLKAADLLATRYRPIVNAATMLGQSKTAHQAEIDAACELTDFFRFNVQFMLRIYGEQLRGSKEDGGALFPLRPVPVLPGFPRSLDRLLDVARVALVHRGEHVILLVRHDALEGLARPYFLAADDHRRLDLLRLHLLQAETQLLALRCARRIRLHMLVFGQRQAEQAGCSGHPGDCRLENRVCDVHPLRGRGLGGGGSLARRRTLGLARAPPAGFRYTRACARNPRPSGRG